MDKGSSARRQLLAQMTGRGYRFEERLFGFSAKDVSRTPPPPYLECLRECLLHQPAFWNPCKPPTELARVLRYWVVKHFAESEQKRLGLYVAVGTPLDFWHGVDCFFYYGEPEQDEDWSDGRRRVTIDVASYDKQRVNAKKVSADLLITPETLVYDLKIVGKHIADYLQNEISLRELKTKPHAWSVTS